MYERTRFGTTPHSQKVVQDSDAYLHRSLSQDLASSDVRQEEQGDISLGWQGKSAASGGAHVVGGVEVLRGTRNDQAVAPSQIVKEVNGARAVGLRKFAVKPS